MNYKLILLCFFVFSWANLQAQEEDTLTAKEYYNTFFDLLDVGEYDLALDTIQRSADLFAKFEVWDNWVAVMQLKGYTYHLLGNSQKAIDLLEPVLKTGLEKTNGVNQAIAGTYYYLGAAKIGVNRFDEGLADYQKALELYTIVDGENSTRTANCHNVIGNYYLDIEKYSEALVYYLNALKIFEQAETTTKNELSTVYNNLGIVYHYEGDLMQGLEFLEAALKINQQIYPENHISIAQNYNNIGLIFYSLYNYDKALEMYDKAIDIYTQNFGAKSKDVLEVLINVTNIYNQAGDYLLSLDEYEKLLPSLKEAFGAESKIMGDIYFNIGSIYENFDGHKGIEYLEKAKKIYKNIPNTIDSLNGPLNFEMSRCYHRMGNYRKAIQYGQKVLKASNKANDPMFQIQTLTALATSYQAKGQENKGLKLLQKALIIGSNDFDNEAISAFPLLENINYQVNILEALSAKMAILFQQSVKENNSQKMQLAKESFELTHQLLMEIRQKWSINEVSKIGLTPLQQQIYQFGALINHHLYQNTKDPIYLQATFNSIEFGKSLLLTEALQNAQAKNFAGIGEEIKQRESTLLKAINRYETLIQKALVAGETNKAIGYKSTELPQAKAAYHDFIASLEQDYPTYYDLKHDLSVVELSELQTALTANDIVIEYAINLIDNQIYVLLIDKETVDFQTLSIPSNFKEEVIDFYKLLQKPTLTRGTNKSYFITKSANLYEWLLAPFEEQLSQKNKLIIVGEGVLNYVPFEALLKNKENQSFEELDFLIKDFEISYHYSANLFYKSAIKEVNASQDLLAFAPVFGTELTNGVLPNLNRNFIDSTYRSIDDQGFTPLIWSEREVKAIKQLFENKNKKAVTTLLHTAANEDALKTEIQNSYQFIHLATHSFANIRYPNFSGLACTQPTLLSETEDGILYTGEVYNLNINTELVVLSSCESGIGKLIDGEGMFGLNRSFIASGVPNVIFSLWKVNDKVSNEFMVEFYSQVLDGQSYSAALRASKLKLLSQADKSSPNFWAAFLLIGK